MQMIYLNLDLMIMLEITKYSEVFVGLNNKGVLFENHFNYFDNIKF